MNDEILALLRLARSEIIVEQEEGRNSRELAITLTHIDTAILWRQHDLQIKQKPVNEAKP